MTGAMTATRPAPRTAAAGRRRLFTREEYQAMGRAGILDEDERVELLGGEIIVMAAIGNRHAACVLRMTSALNVSRLTGRAFLQVQNPVAADPLSEPQPDLMLLAHRDDHYDFDHPSPEEVLLLVEVADSSLDYDRGTKVPFYATSGIREVWIVDLERDGSNRTWSPRRKVSGDAALRAGRGPGAVGTARPATRRGLDHSRPVAVLKLDRTHSLSQADR